MLLIDGSRSFILRRNIHEEVGLFGSSTRPLRLSVPLPPTCSNKSAPLKQHLRFIIIIIGQFLWANWRESATVVTRARHVSAHEHVAF